MGIPRMLPGGESSNQNHKKDEVLSIDGHTREWMLENFNELELLDEETDSVINPATSVDSHIDYELSDEEDDLGDLSAFMAESTTVNTPIENTPEDDFVEDVTEIEAARTEYKEVSVPQNILTEEEIKVSDEDDLDMLLGLDEVEEEFSKVNTKTEINSEILPTENTDDDFYSAFENMSFDEPVEEEFSFDDFDPFSPDTNDLGSSAPLAEEASFEDFATPADPLESDFFSGFDDFASDYDDASNANQETTKDDFGFFENEENIQEENLKVASDDDFSFDDADFSFDEVKSSNEVIPEVFDDTFSLDDSDTDFDEDEENDEFGDFSFDDDFNPDSNEDSQNSEDAFNDVDFDDVFSNIAEDDDTDEDEIEESYFGESFEDQNQDDESEDIDDPDEIEEDKPKEKPAREKKESGGIFGKLKDKAQAIKNEVAAEMKGEEYDPKELSIDEKNRKQQLRAEREEAENQDDDFEKDENPKKSPSKKSGGSGKNSGSNPFSFIGKMYKSLAGFLFGVINTALKILSSLPIIGRIFRPILSMTRMLEKLALFMPALLLIIIFVIVQLIVVPLSSSSELPDSGSISVSQFEYDKESGSVSAMAKNKGDTIADVSVDFKIFKISPTINPITWFVPGEVTTCSSDAVSVDIDSELKVEASCDVVSGILVRATGKAIG